MSANNTIIRYFLIIVGVLCVLLGVAWIFLPLLPDTPFSLLVAACFFHSSKPLYAWLINHKFFGKRILYYRVYKAISLGSKLLSLVLLWLTIGYSAFFVVKIFWLKITLFLIAAGVSVHLISFRTLSKKMIEDIEKEKGE
ncbi:MAG: YbaN family protein [Chrysiogenales bacterium]